MSVIAEGTQVPLSLALRRFAQRLVNVMRPQPRYLPLDSVDIIKTSAGKGLVDGFNDLCYTGGIFKLKWRGSELLKNPCDLFMAVELIEKVRPSLIIETGTHCGASSVYYADMCKLLGVDSHIVTVDINPKWNINPSAFNITSIVGYSTEIAIYNKVYDIYTRRMQEASGPVMVFLDSNHSLENVLAEMELYGKLVTRGSFLIVEDTNVNGHPSFPAHGPGPWEAVEIFLSRHSNFIVDRECERFLLTFNPNGWIRRIE
jgi:cephalosporin hydroxylase